MLCNLKHIQDIPRVSNRFKMFRRLAGMPVSFGMLACKTWYLYFCINLWVLIHGLSPFFSVFVGCSPVNSVLVTRDPWVDLWYDLVTSPFHTFHVPSCPSVHGMLVSGLLPRCGSFSRYGWWDYCELCFHPHINIRQDKIRSQRIDTWNGWQTSKLHSRLQNPGAPVLQKNRKTCACVQCFS